MEDDVLKNSAEAIGITEEDSGHNAEETLKAIVFRASEQLYIALREIIPKGSLSAGLRIGVCAWYGLFYCRLCGDRLKNESESGRAPQPRRDRQDRPQERRRWVVPCLVIAASPEPVALAAHPRA